MTRYLIAATPVHGHVMPMLAIAKGAPMPRGLTGGRTSTDARSST
jgi:hypothetical protein